MSVCTLGWNVVMTGERVIDKDHTKKFTKKLNPKPLSSVSAAETYRKVAVREMERAPDQFVRNVKIKVERALGVDSLEHADPSAEARS